jgi:hypothetical protein
VPSKIAVDCPGTPVPGNIPIRPASGDPDAPIAGSMRRAGCVALAALVVVVAAPVASQASSVEVRDGALSGLQAPGEATSMVVLPVPGAPGSWQVSGARYTFGARFMPGSSNTPQRWPGTAPAPGVGCAPLGTPMSAVLGRAPYLRCDGVASVALAFGDGLDYAQALGGPVTLSGGGGNDALDARACGVGGAVLDGGPGGDDLMIFDGSAGGGPGDDYIIVHSCRAHGEPPIPGNADVDCGPGDDVLRYDGDPRGRVNTRTCPPTILSLRPYGFGPSGNRDRVRIAKDYGLRVPLFRASEPVNGTARLVHDRIAGRRGGEPCSNTVRFRARPGQPVGITVTLSRSLIRLGRKRGFRFLACSVKFSGTDGDGERFGDAFALSMRGYLLELKGREPGRVRRKTSKPR